MHLPCNVGTTITGFSVNHRRSSRILRSFSFLGWRAGPESTQLLPAHRRLPDQTTPLPPPALCLLRAEGQPACSLVNKQSACRRPCLASWPHTEELGIGTV